MNAGRFKVLGTQTYNLELDGVEWASPGAGRPKGSAAPEVGPLSLLFCVLVVLVLCRIFARCIPPTLISVPIQNLKIKYGTNKKGTLPDWNSGSSNFIILK